MTPQTDDILEEVVFATLINTRFVLKVLFLLTMDTVSRSTFHTNTISLNNITRITTINTYKRILIPNLQDLFHKIAFAL